MVPALVTSSPAERDAIVEAARRCYLRYGVAKTTIEDVAEAAGISRTTLYRRFPGHTGLLEAAIRARTVEIAVELQKILDRAKSFPEALLEVSMATIELTRSDEEFRTLTGRGSGFPVHDILIGSGMSIHNEVREFFAPAFAEARAAGELREGITDDEIVEWLSSVWISFILRDELDTKAARRMLEVFMLPSLLPDDARYTRRVR